ncbi:MAG: hypothetical protein AAGK04_08925 [Planctomycetota bacterium]
MEVDPVSIAAWRSIPWLWGLAVAFMFTFGGRLATGFVLGAGGVGEAWGAARVFIQSDPENTVTYRRMDQLSIGIILIAGVCRVASATQRRLFRPWLRAYWRERRLISRRPATPHERLEARLTRQIERQSLERPRWSPLASTRLRRYEARLEGVDALLVHAKLPPTLNDPIPETRVDLARPGSAHRRPNEPVGLTPARLQIASIVASYLLVLTGTALMEHPLPWAACGLLLALFLLVVLVFRLGIPRVWAQARSPFVARVWFRDHEFTRDNARLWVVGQPTSRLLFSGLVSWWLGRGRRSAASAIVHVPPEDPDAESLPGRPPHPSKILRARLLRSDGVAIFVSTRSGWSSPRLAACVSRWLS